MFSEERAKDIAKTIAREKKHTCLVGKPGSGKTFIARRVGDYLGAPRDVNDLRMIGEVRRAMGLERLDTLERPFRAPHHTVSFAGMVGMRPDPDSSFPKYGEFSLAHGGVLFLDELPEFSGRVLEEVARTLRQGTVIHGTRGGNVHYPGNFQLVAAMNPCPCGYHGWEDEGLRTCTCAEQAIKRYWDRVEEILSLVETIDLRF